MRPIVEIREGFLEGSHDAGVHRFLGIPYAAPPVGDRRWRPPSPPSGWNGVRSTTMFGPACPQTVGASFNLRVATQSEDCLYLNVWTATLEPSAQQPVMVWIHGGGNLGGAGSEDAYDGARLARKGAVAVTFNYRLGAFGFLAHPDMGANFAVLDQLAALEWVRTHISRFGGDPGNVTVFGESAGAVAVRTLLSCPMAQGLFHRAIMQSGGFEPPAVVASWSYARAEAAAEALFERLDTRSPDELRAAPTAAVKQASHELSGIFPQPGKVHTPANLVWMPVVDGKIVVGGGYPGWATGVPLLLGCVENEARYFIKPGGTYSREVLQNMAKGLCGPRADSVLALLDAENLSPYEALDKLYTAAIWAEPALETVRKFAAAGRRLYCYHFARVSPGAAATQDLVKHTAEIRYVFGNLTEDDAYDIADRHVSDLVQNAWIAFARDGVPESPRGVAWPRYDAGTPAAAYIEDTVAIRPSPVPGIVAELNFVRRALEKLPSA